MEQELQIIHNKIEEDEIDLYELIEIILRYKKLIVQITLFCIMISFGGALYIESQTPNYLVKNIGIFQDSLDLKNINTIDTDVVFLRDNNVKKILEIEGIKDEYLKKIPIKSRNINSERKFLESRLRVIKDNKNTNLITLKAKIIDEEKNTSDLIKKYIDILKLEDNTKEIIELELRQKTNELQKIEKDLEIIQTEILNLFKNDTDLNSLKSEDKKIFLNFKYPALMMKVNEIEKYHNSYSNELLKLKNLNIRHNSVVELSDIYLEKGESKSKLILAVGTTLGIFLSIVLVFIKEFINGYKKRYLKK
ncbi:MAG: hypothetical protein ACRC51_03485 [Cetobacterium sp.]